MTVLNLSSALKSIYLPITRVARRQCHGGPRVPALVLWPPPRLQHHPAHEAQGSHVVTAVAGFDLLRQSWLNKAPQTPRGKEYTPPFLHKQRRLRLALKTRQLINEMAKWKIVSSCSSCFSNCKSSQKGQRQSLDVPVLGTNAVGLAVGGCCSDCEGLGFHKYGDNRCAHAATTALQEVDGGSDRSKTGFIEQIQGRRR